MPNDADYMWGRALKCRRLARETEDEAAMLSLLSLASEYEARAEAIDKGGLAMRGGSSGVTDEPGLAVATERP